MLQEKPQERQSKKQRDMFTV